MNNQSSTASHPNPGHRLLVLADRLGATQSISFTLPINLNSGDIESVDIYSRGESRLAYLTQAEFWLNHRPTVLVLSRYTDPAVLPLLKLARKYKVPSVFHIDDDLLDMPATLAERYEVYQDPSRRIALRTALDSVDLVYASTLPLAERLIEHGITTEIFAGSIYCSVDPERMPALLPSTGPVLGYMGSGGHSTDLATVMPTIVRLMKEMPLLRFETFGTISPPPEMSDFGGRYAHHSGLSDYTAFLARLNELGWWVGIAPLDDNPFNRCKADTKWVEYSFAGSAVVASDLPVYHRACAGGAGATARDADEWYTSLGLLLRSADLRRKMVEIAREKVRRLYTHQELQKQLLAVLEQAARARLRRDLND